MRTRVAAVAAVMWLLTGCGPRPEVIQVQAVPSESSPSPTPTESSTAAPTEPTEATETPSETDRLPTDTDRARFVSEFNPDDASGLQHVALDLDGDQVDELVFRYVGGGAAHVDVAWWTGITYEIGFRGTGGAATMIDQVRTADINGDGLIEIVSFQSGEGPTASLTMWQVVAPEQVAPLPAVGGCHDGSNTYGAAGAQLDDRDVDGAMEIYATCDDSPLPVGEWSTDRYLWDGAAYRFTPEPSSG